MKYYEETIKVADLHLDRKNPRFPPVNSQREAIDAILMDQGEKIVVLALDIYQYGLNPSVKLIIFKEGENFVDGDGNRRLTALKLLETPSLADAFPKIRKKIDAILKKPGTVPAEVGCVVFSSRKAARHWISINHGGEQEGRGQITWDAEQKDRFEHKPSIGLEALDLLTNMGYITAKDKSRINKSTLDRLLSYKGVKSILSISKKNDRFVFGDVNYLRKTILQLMGVTVDEVYTAEKGNKFIQEAIASTEALPLESADVLPLESTEVLSLEPTGTHPLDVGEKFTDDPEGSPNEEFSQGSRTRRVKKPSLRIFGGKLSLEKGHVNNLYRDIESLSDFHHVERSRLSLDFIVIIRMSLRMLVETAAKEVDKSLRNYLTDNFDLAKKSLNQNERTTLSNQNVTKDSIVQLFQTGAHDYHNSKNEEQALALSIVLGAMLELSHGKKS